MTVQPVWTIGLGPWYLTLVVIAARPFASVRLVAGRAS
jgi:hypothetical protein